METFALSQLLQHTNPVSFIFLNSLSFFSFFIYLFFLSDLSRWVDYEVAKGEKNDWVIPSAVYYLRYSVEDSKIVSYS